MLTKRTVKKTSAFFHMTRWKIEAVCGCLQTAGMERLFSLNEKPHGKNLYHIFLFLML